LVKSETLIPTLPKILCGCPAGLNNLPSAVRDVDALWQVLVNPEIGGFGESDIAVLKDADEKPIREAIHNLFTGRQPDDLLLFYFSGHGITDKYNNFYLTGTATRDEAPEHTAVQAEYLHNLMGRSRSQRQVLILDCCHSGAIAKGLRHKGSEKVQVLPKLGGEGRAILKASDSTEYAFEQEGFELSLYTHFLVEGLRTGAADRDGDGDISIDELYDYVRAKVKSTNDLMSPEFHPVREGHRIILAKAALDDPKLRFRREVEKVADRHNKGILLPTARNRLNRESQSLGLSPPEAAEIIQEVLRPYVEYAEKLEEYAQTLEEMIALRFPFDEVMAADLEDYESYLGLRPTDQQAIKERIIAPRQAEFDRQLQAAQRQEAAQRLNQQRQEEAERLQRQQAEQLRQKQLEAEKRLEAERQRAKSSQELTIDLAQGITLELVRIPAGKFMMGSNEDDSEKPIHEVTIQPFYLGKYPITQEQYQAVMGSNPSRFKGAKLPVEQVSWDDAVKFCEKLSQNDKKYRLPSEAEWEYACRAGTQTKYYFGDDQSKLKDYAWYRENSGSTTHPVGEKKPNAFGLYDMYGNVWEWCSDRWHENYNNAPTDGSSWETGTVKNYRALRGGSWSGDVIYCRSAYRFRINASNRNDFIGFRLVVA